jgi:hypothetical protein
MKSVAMMIQARHNLLNAPMMTPGTSTYNEMPK